jgi:hypothetical protein
MRQLLTVLLAFSLLGASGATQIHSYVGTWSCSDGGSAYSVRFTSILGGNGLRISDIGPNPGEQTVVFDPKRKKWIDIYVTPAGAYAVLEGTPSGKTIHFVQMYPPRTATLIVTRMSATKYTDAFTSTSNGKRMTTRETCTKE